jgi:hypothetical protein
MPKPRDPRFEYVADASGRVRKMESIACEQCGNPALVRAGHRFCSKACAVLKQHADGKSRQASGPEHYAWKGSDAGYQALHMRIIRSRGRADHCEWRDKAGCKSRKYEWAHLHGTDPGDVQNYVSLCKTCHQRYDGQQGSGHANAKLTDTQVTEIRIRYDAGGISQQSLADEFAVDQSTISKVVLGERYRVH